MPIRRPEENETECEWDDCARDPQILDPEVEHIDDQMVGNEEEDERHREVAQHIAEPCRVDGFGRWHGV